MAKKYWVVCQAYIPPMVVVAETPEEARAKAEGLNQYPIKVICAPVQELGEASGKDFEEEVRFIEGGEVVKNA